MSICSINTPSMVSFGYWGVNLCPSLQPSTHSALCLGGQTRMVKAPTPSGLWLGSAPGVPSPEMRGRRPARWGVLAPSLRPGCSWVQSLTEGHSSSFGPLNTPSPKPNTHQVLGVFRFQDCPAGPGISRLTVPLLRISPSPL